MKKKCPTDAPIIIKMAIVNDDGTIMGENMAKTPMQRGMQI